MTATQPDGSPVRNLLAGEVGVEQDGDGCAVRALDPGPDVMSIALMVENSSQTAGFVVSLRDGLRAFLDALPVSHRVGLFTMAGPLRLRADLTTGRTELRREVDGLFPQAGALMLLDGLLETWERRFDSTDAWPVFVLVIHDGLDLSNILEHKVTDFLDSMRARAATVHTILVSNGAGGMPRVLSMELTRFTGGTYRTLAASTALPRALAELATAMGTHYEDMKERYRMVYECENAPTAGNVQVGVSRPEVALRLFLDRQMDR